MPKGSKYEGPTEALVAYRQAVEGSQMDAEVKGAKNLYTSRNGSMFSFLTADGTMALRLSTELTEEFRANCKSYDVVQFGATMRGYSSVSDELLGQTETLAVWFDRSWEWIGTQPAKHTKK